MAKNRKAAQDTILKWVNEILPGEHNQKCYQALFDSMDDDQFDDWIQKLKRGEIRLCIIAPNQSESRLTVENNLRVAEMIGHNFFQKIWMDGKQGTSRYLSNVPYLIVDLTIRRQAQLLVKKISIPENNRSVDNLTGQPTGDSKGSKISYPELQILRSHGLDYSITELIKYRGGDMQGFQAMNDSIAKTGKVSLDSISKLGTQVQSTITLSTLLTSMHLQNTLLQ